VQNAARMDLLGKLPACFPFPFFPMGPIVCLMNVIRDDKRETWERRNTAAELNRRLACPSFRPVAYMQSFLLPWTALTELKHDFVSRNAYEFLKDSTCKLAKCFSALRRIAQSCRPPMAVSSWDSFWSIATSTFYLISWRVPLSSFTHVLMHL
jgi:hypothetical protein